MKWHKGPCYEEGAQTAPHYGADELQLLALLQVEDTKAEDYGGGGKHRQDHHGEERSAYQEESSQPKADEGCGRPPAHG